MCNIVSDAVSLVATMILEKKIYSGGGDRIIKITIVKTSEGAVEEDIKHYLDVSCFYLKTGVPDLTDVNQGWNHFIQTRFAVMKDGTTEHKRHTMMPDVNIKQTPFRGS